MAITIARTIIKIIIIGNNIPKIFGSCPMRKHHLLFLYFTMISYSLSYNSRNIRNCNNRSNPNCNNRKNRNCNNRNNRHCNNRNHYAVLVLFVSSGQGVLSIRELQRILSRQPGHPHAGSEVRPPRTGSVRDT